MDLSCLDKILENEPKYRLKQVKEAVFGNLIESWSEASNLPAKLIERLNKECSLLISAEIIKSGDKGDVLKAVIALDDDSKIESVLMRHDGGRSTVCVSSQVGCSVKCSFCATGSSGFKRNLTEYEIIEQVLFFSRYLKNKYDERVSNIVFMGMGEPFLNYENVISAIKILNDKDGLNIGARKISISTSGIIEGIEKLAEEKLQVNLALSLHAPNDELRSKLMPVNKKYPLKDVLKAIKKYTKKTSRQVMFEYILLRGVNDTEEHAKKLAYLMKGQLHFVNLIVYNPVGKSRMLPSSSRDVKKFKEILEMQGILVGQRYHFGGQIKAACGQLGQKQ